MKKISVIIPTYNSENYLEKCIESVVNQTLKEIEIIIINDCSQDNSLKIINKFAQKDKRIKIINNTKNLGYGKSVNLGIKNSNNDFISIVESDDSIEPNMLETLLKESTKQDYDIIKSDFNYIVKNKTIKANSFKNFNLNTSSNIFNNPEILTIKPSVWSAIYKKEFLNRNNIFFNETQKASFQDTSFQFKCFYFAKKYKLINKALYNYKTDNPSSSINSSDKVFELIDEFKTINNFFKPQTNEIASQKLLFELKAYLWNYKRIKNKYNKIFLKEVSKMFKEYDFKPFFKNKKIPLKEKIKAKLIIENSNLSLTIFSTYKFLSRKKWKTK